MNPQTRWIKLAFRFALSLALTIALVGPLAGPPGAARASGPYVVSVSYDGPDSNPGDGICWDGVSGCTLRAAIQEAFYDGAATTITFDSALAGTTFSLSAAYGTIIWAGSNITLDGESEANNITISGATLAPGQSIFQIQGSNNIIRYLTIRDAPQDGIQVGDFAGVGEGNYNLISTVTLLGNGAAGVYVYGSASGGGHHTTLMANRIGTSSASATACTAGEGNGGSGVYIAPDANNTDVYLNRLVCNAHYGVYVYGVSGSPTGVTIRNNDIGGYLSNDMGNGWGGIRDSQASTTSISGNVIIGNGADGIWLENDDHASVKNNWIGYSDLAGTTATPNEGCGIAITDGANYNEVGSINLADRNYVGGNGSSGVCMLFGAHDNSLEFNYIGLSYNGLAAIPNGGAGVSVIGSDNNAIGSSMYGVEQYISGNALEGIHIENSGGTFIGPTNLIGVASDQSTPLGNGLEGVMLDGATNTSVFATLVAHNGGAGVAVVGDTAVNNKIHITEDVHGNGGLPVDLGNDGPTPNGSRTPPGPNNWLAYPVITGGSGSNVSGTACNGCTVYIYEATGNPTAAGGGGVYAMSVTADASGNWSASLPGGLTQADITTVACEAPCSFAANTSEFSPLVGGGGGYRTYLPVVIGKSSPPIVLNK